MTEQELLNLMKSIDPLSVRVPPGILKLVNTVITIERHECEIELKEGYVLVPIEPNVELREWIQDVTGCSFLRSKGVYRDIIKKAAKG
jgi:hypothetical protein